MSSWSVTKRLTRYVVHGMGYDLTVWYLKTQETHKEKGSNVGEVIAFEMEVLVDAHNSSILDTW